VEEAVKRIVLAIVSIVGASLALAPAVGAQSVTPAGSFTSPTRAVAGAPIFVRSITPCPMHTGAYEYATAYIRDQAEPGVSEEIEYTMADLRPDGSWELTIAAPIDMPHGVTKSYSVHAECTVAPEPYLNDFFDQEASPDPAEYFRYPLRPLFVTGFGPSEAVEGEGPSGVSTTTTSTTAPPAAPVAPVVMSSSGAKQVPTSTTTTAATVATPAPTAAPRIVDDPSMRWDQIRRELAARESTTQRLELASATADTERVAATGDDGIPWWAFALATMLAVGAVIGFGVRRTSVLRQLDR
jgi:hypothetical protein